MPSSRRYRWFVLGVFFLFMLLHQTDKLLIGPLTSQIMDTFQIDEAQMGMVFTGAMVVGAVLYPLWGYLYDRFARAKLLALASLIWGATTWLSALAPNYGAFLATRASTGIDDSSYPGIYSLVSDYFAPKVRGKVYAMLTLTAPLGYMAGLVLALLIGPQIGWRNVFVVTGVLGMALAALIFLTVREAPRGQSEPELAGLEEIAVHRFEWRSAVGLLRRRTLLPIYAQGFFGVFPWNVLSAWFFRYLETERGYSNEQVLPMMAAAVLAMAGGNVVGGALGDWLFGKTRRGRLVVCTFGVLMGALMLFLTMRVPLDQTLLFTAALCATALFIPFSGPNIISTVHDITQPEARSTALAVQYFVESTGAAMAPLIVGMLAVRSSLTEAIMLVCGTAWLVCGVLLGLATYLVPRDIEALRAQMQERAQESRELVHEGHEAHEGHEGHPARG